MEWVCVSSDKRSFVLEKSGRQFVPWGFNYVLDEQGRLIEDYWEKEWSKVEEDFCEMKQLGANIVRVHLQLGKFMKTPEQVNGSALDQLARLVNLSERLGLYIDLTGLNCYRKRDVPDWYERLSEKQRWDVQARFWEHIARRFAKSPAIFCYDLMNEPVVPAGPQAQWLGPPFDDGMHYVQFIVRDPAGRDRPNLARQWISHLVAAIRKHDRRRMITVGLVDWSLDRPGLTSGFVPEVIAENLDFISVHIYPKTGKLEEAMTTLKGFAVGKPILVEEMFPLYCSPQELERFIDESAKIAAGWLGFYWGKMPDEYRPPKDIADAVRLEWLELFQRKRKVFAPPNQPGP